MAEKDTHVMVQIKVRFPLQVSQDVVKKLREQVILLSLHWAVEERRLFQDQEESPNSLEYR